MTVREDNPFRKFRTELGISQTEFAKRAGVSKHAILRLEQGMYDKPLPSVVEYVTSQSDLTNYSLLKDYEYFQQATRQDNELIFGAMALRLMNCPVGTHPLTYLRDLQGLNQTELAKRLCISQTVINNFESKPATQHTVPLQLLHALRDNGYKHSALVALEEWYEAYRNRLVKNNAVKLVEPNVVDKVMGSADTVPV
jgi:DNA-binding XRE family transcriptional regulator